ncbi:ERMES complex subunit mmm1 [Endocarpon pusillum]|uniref:Maintenance of mitochondrial morphology protein 1 n=1 Tax=Endocarpon pusillum TaxID=364733 RepID=A0A8H7ANX7_9EURO|nr:ERMES complex subunit mmm1 [Endocarpon pusillum]
MNSNTHTQSTPPIQSSLSFTQGLLVGQLSVVLLLGAFIKFFIFGEAPPPQSRNTSGYHAPKHIRTSSLHSHASNKSSPPRSLGQKASVSNILRQVPINGTDTASILRKTYYQTLPPTKIKGKSHGRTQTHHSSHQPESLDWFNVLIAQVIAQYRQTAYNMKDTSSSTPSILSTLVAALNNPNKRPSFIDHINVTEISLGEEFPIFSNCRVIEVEDENATAQAGGRLQALMDVDLSDDNLTLAIETSLLLNYPKPFSAILPVALAVSVVRFSGTLSISFVPATPPAEETSEDIETDQTSSGGSSPKTNLAFSFLPDYRLDLSIRSLVGSRSRLQDVPKIAQLVEARVQAWFEERVVEPRVQVVGLPGLWPRMGKTRVRDGDDGKTGSEDGKDEPMHRRSSFRQRKNQQSVAEDPFLDGFRLRAGRGTETVFRADDDIRMPGSMPT